MPDYQANRRTGTNSRLGRTTSRTTTTNTPRGAARGITTNRQSAQRTTASRSRRVSSRRVVSRRIRQRKGTAVKGAQNQLKKFRMGSILAVAITGFLLLLFAPAESGYSQDISDNADTEMTAQAIEADEDSALADQEEGREALPTAEITDTQVPEEEVNNEPLTKAAKDEAIGALQRLWNRFNSNLPKILVAFGIFLFAWLLTKLLRWTLRKLMGHWERAGATIALVNIFVWLFAVGLAISILVGDIRAMVGSLGLIGLALSWSLQSPIESFTGWLINSFRGYYRIGDRISVGDVVGDVYKIDFLTTTVWEIGSPYREAYLQAEQPTGRLVTFPNNEVLSGSVVNYTSDFPYVWDELVVGIANESDIKLSMEVLEKAAKDVLGDYMKEPALQYSRILKQAGLNYEIADKPQVFLSTTDSWTNVIIRYLVGARERRKWKTALILQTAEATGKPEYADKIIPVYTRQQIQMINPQGEPVSLDSYEEEEDENHQ